MLCFLIVQGGISRIAAVLGTSSSLKLNSISMLLEYICCSWLYEFDTFTSFGGYVDSIFILNSFVQELLIVNDFKINLLVFNLSIMINWNYVYFFILCVSVDYMEGHSYSSFKCMLYSRYFVFCFDRLFRAEKKYS